ncbi:UNVERIFIED_CONTAM: hypothetical protein RMT77_019660 [Armadillidium vulgare]
MRKLFENLRYDLAKNKVYREEGKISLKFEVLTILIELLCRKGVITEYLYYNIETLRDSEDTSVKYIIANNLTEILTEMNILEPSNLNFFLLSRFRTYIKEIVYFIAMEICDLLKKETVAKDSWMNVSLLLKNLSITRQGTLDLMTTVRRILRKEQLDPSHSCELACFYFIIDDILNTHCEMVIYQRSSYFEGHAKYKDVKECLNYWRWFIIYCHKDHVKILLQDSEKMHQMTDRILFYRRPRETIINMFMECAKCNNEIAVHYLWSNYVSKIKSVNNILRKVLLISASNSLHINITMFLLFQIDIKEFEKLIMKSIHLLILINILRNTRWHFCFTKIFRVIKVYFDFNAFLTLLKILLDTYFIDSSTEINIITEYISTFPHYIKNCLSSENIFNNILTKPFINGKKELVNFLLTFSNIFYLRDFLFSDTGINLVSEAIQKGNLEFIKNFTQERYMRYEIVRFKRFLFYSKREILYKHFMQIRQYQKLMDLIDWLSEEISENLQGYNERMLCKNNGLYLKHMLYMTNVDSNSNPFPIVSKFLLRCFKTNGSVSCFKRKIILYPIKSLNETSKHISCYEELKIWIIKSKWNLLEMFFSWKDCTLIDKLSFLNTLINDKIFISEIVLRARDCSVFLRSFIDFLKTHLDLNDVETISLKKKIFDQVLQKNPNIEDSLRYWYNYSRSAENLHLLIKDSGIKFLDYTTLYWLTSQDIN